MKSRTRRHLNNRVLKIKVGFLLAAGPGNSHNSRFDIPDSVLVSDDLVINAIHGDLRLSRMKEGILVQGRLHIAIDSSCSRCLDTFEQIIDIDLEELYAYPAPIDDSTFVIGMDTVLDLAPLIRAEVLIETSHKLLCSPTCQGLCPQCGVNRNHETCDCERDAIDPRMAKLKELLDSVD